MPYFALMYDTIDNFVERRLPYRGEHLALVQAEHKQGRLVMAGALKPSGAMLIFKMDGADAVEQFARQDPYVLNGVVTGWRVHEWTVVVGGDSPPR